MRQILLSISFFLIVNILTINIASAQARTGSDVKQSEKKMDCGKCPMAKGCAMMADAKTIKDNVAPESNRMTCDSTKCNGKSDMTKCKSAKEATSSQRKDCDPAKCKMMSKK